MNASRAAVVTPLRTKEDPFAGMDTALVRSTLVAKGWPDAALGTDGDGLTLMLGDELVAVVTTGVDGQAALDKITAAHGALPRTPTLTHMDGERRTVRIFRAPGGQRLPNAENLHGAAGGVSVVSGGTQPLPPRNGYNNVWATWDKANHAATRAIAELPEWLADAARDPLAAAKLATTVRPTKGMLRELASWESKLVRSRGKTVNTFGNVMKIFRDAPCYSGRFRLNLMTQGVEFESKHLPEGRLGAFREEIEDAPWGGFSPSEASVMQAIRALAEEQAHHPVREYLGRLAWDGVPRLDTVASELLRVQDPDALTVTMVRRWFISAVARALDPGCQVDTALVLMGEQGLRKSSFFRALAGERFADTEIRIGDKDAYGQIHAAWITEWGEIDRITTQRHAGEVKAFISRRSDLFRPPYGRTTANFPRSCVLVGSTNESEFLTDPTGSRRFWVVRVTEVIDANAVAAIRDQLWAEATAAYRAGEIHYLGHDEDKARELAAEQYRVRDAWENVIEEWIESRWRAHRLETGQTLLTTAIVLRFALGMEPKHMDRACTMRVGRCMAALGYANRRVRVPQHQGRLYADPSNEPARLVHAWESLSTPERSIEEDDETPIF